MQLALATAGEKRRHVTMCPFWQIPPNASMGLIIAFFSIPEPRVEHGQPSLSWGSGLEPGSRRALGLRGGREAALLTDSAAGTGQSPSHVTRGDPEEKHLGGCLLSQCNSADLAVGWSGVETRSGGQTGRACPWDKNGVLFGRQP